jgi:cardiolipin synthase (CMP-forming)
MGTSLASVVTLMQAQSSEADGRYRWRDCWALPNLVSFLRLPLALAFLWASRQPRLALGILLAAAATDVVDGYLARRLGRATAVGAVVDGALDKLFAAAVAGSLLWRHQLAFVEACLLFARELVELPLVFWWGVDRAQRRERATKPGANWLGKLATVIQFFSLAAVLNGSPLRTPLSVVTAGCGAAAAALYWTREIRAGRSASRPPAARARPDSRTAGPRGRC